jgi:hypothetical protein
MSTARFQKTGRHRAFPSGSLNSAQKRFNILSHPSFQNPSGNVFNANLAAANPNDPTSVSPNGGVGRNTATNSSPRQIQLALKIVF